MYDPCQECLHCYSRDQEWCDQNCGYAIAVKDIGEYVHELSKYRAAVIDANERLEKMLGKFGDKED